MYPNNMMSILLNFLISVNVWSAPHPTTGTTMINQISNGHVFSQFGFQLQGRMQIPWILEQTDSKNKEFNLVYGSGRLNLKSEVVSANLQLDQYIKKYLKDYSLYGFKVSKIDNQTSANEPHIILEVEKKNDSVRAKQYFYMHKQKVLIATCTDDSESFERTAHLCQRFVDEIHWLE